MGIDETGLFLRLGVFLHDGDPYREIILAAYRLGRQDQARESDQELNSVLRILERDNDY
jgi:hypothetical protein